MPHSRQPLQSSPEASEPLQTLRRGGQLFETERRLNAVLNNASVAIFLMDDRQHCIYMNRAAELLTGYTLDEVLARDCPLHDIVHHTYPDGRPFPLAECAIDRAFPQNNQEKGEEVLVHKDGSFYPVAFTASPIRDDTANIIGTIIEVRDITEEKAAAERQRLLIDELNHRVKNTLATVQALAAQSFRDTDPTAQGVFNARLAALSNAHNVLTADNWQSASLRDVIERSLAPHLLAEVDARRFQLNGPDGRLHPKVAVTLAMALHELMTNAAKYGALSVPAGHVTVDWSLQSDEAGTQRLSLIWREHGGPPVAPPARKGFGSRLIERQLTREFDGHATIAYDPGGVICRLQIPLTALGWYGQEKIEGQPAR
ncbi:sensor histidine kinase [Methylobacterium frigidaeris]|uniref:sensor histidine kinase n=2 Tax=Methylobacterium frigidaeris TaxID=2038277 RepID=UPI001EDED708|nr:HWE histidine kinase domain-containing protein [Methylobacterium frigidaeris]